MGAVVNPDPRIAVPEDLWREIIATLDQDVETAGVLLAGMANDLSGLTLLGRRVRWVPDHLYAVRTPTRLTIGSPGFVPALGEAARDGSTAIFLHSHPKGRAHFSELDDVVDQELRSLFQQRTRSGMYTSLIIGGTSSAPEFRGRIFSVDGAEAVPITSLRVVGRRLLILPESGSTSYKPPHTWDRQVRAFGSEGQRALSHMHIGVVGAGGTGSAVCEQLIRLGVGHLTVVDNDVVDDTNLPRIHESASADLGNPKVEVVKARAGSIGLGSEVVGIRERLKTPDVARLLSRCDAIFACTDDELGRGVLSRLSYWYLIPVFDVGVLIASAEGSITDVIGRVTVVLPGTACLLCRGRITPSGIQAEAMTEDERARRAGEGYAPGLGEPAPSVITFTSMMASLAVSEMLERLFGYGIGDPPSEILIRFRERAMNRNSTDGRAGHYCVDQSKWGRGDQEPYLGQLWA